MTTEQLEQLEQLEQNNYKHEIIIDRIACPLHVLQMKNGMNKIESGDVLKIKSTAYVAPELLAAARQIGNDVVINEQNEIYIIKR